MNQTIYPIGIQNFEKIRKDGYLYIDKTALIYQLAKTGSYLFLESSTAFQARVSCSSYVGGLFPREEGAVRGVAAMERLEKDWEAYPDLAFGLECSSL